MIAADETPLPRRRPLPRSGRLGPDLPARDCESPVGAGSDQPIERFLIAGTNGAVTRISDIPATATNDPLALALDNQYELFVSNRAGHSGNGSVSRFRFDSFFQSFVIDLGAPNGLFATTAGLRASPL